MTSPLHRLAPALGLAMALVAPAALAQSKTEEKATPKAAPPGGFNPLGDPSRFTRMGGWGGMGAGMAQFGLAKAMLINMPAVQKELKLSEDQVKAIREWGDGLRKRGEAMFRRQATGGNAPADPNAPAPPGQPLPDGGPSRPADAAPPPAPANGPPSPMAMLEMVSTITREGESSLAKILTKKQFLRLNQIALQMEGVSALGRTEVAEAMYLSPEQVAAIQEVLNEAKGQQIGHFLQQGFAMRGRRDPGAGPGGPAPRRSEAKKADAPPDDPEAQAKRRQAERDRRQAEFAKFRDGSDRIQDAATAKILGVLSKKQRERFDKLLGEPFDPAKLSGPGGFGGPPRPDGAPSPEAKPADVTKPADAAPSRSSRLRDSRFKGESKSQP